MNQKFYEAMEDNPVIAAVKDDEGLELCCKCDDIKIVFIIYGDVCSIRRIVSKVHEKGKIAMVHIDLIGGLSSKEIAVDYIKQETEADGIISTKPALIKRAKALSMDTILRVFLLDSMAFHNLEHQVQTGRPDVVEILPGLIPKAVKRVCSVIGVPVIAGGLITEKEDVLEALDAGAMAVSSTNKEVWFM